MTSTMAYLPQFFPYIENHPSLLHLSTNAHYILPCINLLQSNRLWTDSFAFPSIEQEILTIENIARVNSLNVDLCLLIKHTKLQRSLKESRLSLEFQDLLTSFPNSSSCAQSSPLQENKEKWIHLPYLDQPSEKLSRKLRPYGYKEKSGIYFLKCSCGDVTILHCKCEYKLCTEEYYRDEIK